MIDYELLSKVIEPEHIFFELHRKAKHFDWTYESLDTMWQQDPSKVKEAFIFVGNTQAKMWKDLSDAVFKQQ